MRAIDLNVVITKSLDVGAIQQNQQNAVVVQQQANVDEANKTALRQQDQVLQSNAKAKREAIDNEEKSEEERREKETPTPRAAKSRGTGGEVKNSGTGDAEQSQEGLGNSIDIKA